MSQAAKLQAGCLSRRQREALKGRQGEALEQVSKCSERQLITRMEKRKARTKTCYALGN